MSDSPLSVLLNSDLSSTATRLPRKRGGQPHNTNAIKHGFYSTRFNPREQVALDLLRPGLEDEINMLRVFTRRVFEKSDGVDDLARLSSTLNALSAAVYRLAALLRTQDVLNQGQETELESIINQARLEVLEEMGIHGKR